MARLSKRLIANHNKALKILKKDILSEDDKLFVFENYNEGAFRDNAYFGAFFTPLGMADYLAFDTIGDVYGKPSLRVVDLCAGIGAISYAVLKRYPCVNITCVEVNPDYVEIGKKLVPEANWVLASVLDINRMLSLGHFDFAIMNPPFGRVRSLNGDAFKYSGALAEFKVLDVASHIADSIGAIVPQNSAGYKYSGDHGYEYIGSKELNRFQNETGIHVDGTIGHDLSDQYCGQFKNVSIAVEIITADTSHVKYKAPPKQVQLF